jgi:hypothetical protein
MRLAHISVMRMLGLGNFGWGGRVPATVAMVGTAQLRLCPPL